MQTYITLDIDWAPDFVIDSIANRLLKARVKATWFVTHNCPAVERLREYTELFELGIHPNFLEGSTQGDDPGEVLAHCLELVPDARSMCTHQLVQSSPLLERVCRDTQIAVDASLFLPRARNLEPIVYWTAGRPLMRVPFFWEDDFEMMMPDPIWSAADLVARPGLKIFNFHPIHVYLNGADMSPYKELKRRSDGNIAAIRAGDAIDLVSEGIGPSSVLDSLIDIIGANGKLMRDFMMDVADDEFSDLDIARS